MSLEQTEDTPRPFDDATLDELRYLLNQGAAGRKVYWTATPERIAERNRRICEDYRAGDYIKRIAWRYGCGKSLISEIARRYGLELRQRRRPRNLAVEAAAREWLEECKKPIGVRLSGRAVAKKHGVNHNQLAGFAWRLRQREMKLCATAPNAR